MPTSMLTAILETRWKENYSIIGGFRVWPLSTSLGFSFVTASVSGLYGTSRLISSVWCKVLSAPF